MARFQQVQSSPVSRLTVDRIAGLNLDRDITQIEKHESPDLLNIVLDPDGTPDTRTGYERIFNVSLGGGKVLGVCEFGGMIVFAFDTGAHTKLYSLEKKHLNLLNNGLGYVNWYLMQNAQISDTGNIEMSTSGAQAQILLIESVAEEIGFEENVTYTLVYDIISSNATTVKLFYAAHNESGAQIHYSANAMASTAGTHSTTFTVPVGAVTNRLTIALIKDNTSPDPVETIEIANMRIYNGLWGDTGPTPTLRHGDIGGSAVKFVNYGENLYVVTDSNFWVWDGETVPKTVSSDAYVPIMVISANPSTGAGETLESKNLLTPLYRQWFNGDGPQKTILGNPYPTGGRQLYGTVGVGQRFLADFTKNISKKIESIGIYTIKVGSPGNIEVELYDVTADVSVATKSLAEGEVNNGGWTRFTFNVPATITPGNAVDIRVTSPTSNNTTDYYRMRVSEDHMPNANLIWTDDDWLTAYNNGTESTPFAINFEATGTEIATTQYKLALRPHLNGSVIVRINGMALTEDRHFSVDTVNSIVDFAKGTHAYGSPPDGLNNVEIEAQDNASAADTTSQKMVENCTISHVYGGENDTRIHLSGNPDHPERIWHSGVSDPTYWPENSYTNVGVGADPVTGFANQYGSCVVFKKHSIWLMNFELDSNANPTFPTRPLNSAIGAIAPDSIQLIGNAPVFLSENGIYTLTASQVRDERNVQRVSQAVDAKLMKEDVENAISADYENKYLLLFPNGSVWVYDYSRDGWLYWDSVPASCVAVIDRRLCLGDSRQGLVHQFKWPDEFRAYLDDGEAINSYWKTKVFEFDAPEYYKMVLDLVYQLRADIHTNPTIFYETEKAGNWAEVATETINSHSKFPKTIRKKLKLKKVQQLQLQFASNRKNKHIGVLAFTIRYLLQKVAK